MMTSRVSLLERFLPWVLLGGALVLYLRLSLLHYAAFRTGIDLASYAQAMDYLAHGMLPWSSFKGEVLWGDHAHFFLVALLPFYLLRSRPDTLLVLQVLAVVGSGWPFYQLALQRTKRWWIACLFLFSYLFFIGWQFALQDDMHPSVFTGALLLWALFAVSKRQWFFYSSVVFLGLLTREDAPLIFALLGLFFLLSPRTRFRGAVTCIVSILYFLLIAYVLMPQWTHGHTVLAYLQQENKNPFAVATDILFHPRVYLQDIVDTDTKRKTLGTLVWAFGGLPLGSFFTYLSSATILYSRFTSPEEYRWVMTNYSNANSAPLLAYGALLTFSSVCRWAQRFLSRPLARICTALLLLLLSAGTISTAFFYPHAPLKESFSRYTLTGLHRSEAERARNVDILASYIPPRASLAASSGFASHLGSRPDIINVPEGLDRVEWVLMTTSNTMNTWPLDGKESREMVNTLLHTAAFYLIEKRGDVYLFHRRS